MSHEYRARFDILTRLNIADLVAHLGYTGQIEVIAA
jgi:hypothetical protein